MLCVGPWHWDTSSEERGEGFAVSLEWLPALPKLPPTTGGDKDTWGHLGTLLGQSPPAVRSKCESNL